jgi:hypothetical protein
MPTTAAVAMAGRPSGNRAKPGITMGHGAAREHRSADAHHKDHGADGELPRSNRSTFSDWISATPCKADDAEQEDGHAAGDRRGQRLNQGGELADKASRPWRWRPAATSTGPSSCA